MPSNGKQWTWIDTSDTYFEVFQSLLMKLHWSGHIKELFQSKTNCLLNAYEPRNAWNCYVSHPNTLRGEFRLWIMKQWKLWALIDRKSTAATSGQAGEAGQASGFAAWTTRCSGPYLWDRCWRLCIKVIAWLHVCPHHMSEEESWVVYAPNWRSWSELKFFSHLTLALHRFTLYQSKRPQTPFSNLKPWFKHATKDLGSEHVFSLRNSVFPSVSVGFLHTKCYTKSAIYISPACGTHSRSSSQHPGTSPRWQSFCSKLAARFGKAVQQRSQRSVERTFEGDLAYASAASAPFTLFFLIHLILEKSWKNACGLHTRDRTVICFAASQTQIHRYTMTMIYIEITLIYRLVMFS